MIALLVGTGAAFVLCIFTTPALIRVLRAKGIGQQIRDDGPFAHPHEKKAGTPTMGGIAIVSSALFGYLVAHVSTEQTKFARTGITLMALVVGMAVVGFVDDYLGVRRGRNMGLRKRGKTGGQIVVAAGFALLALNYVNVSTQLSFTRVFDLDLATALWFVLAVFWVYGFSNAVNITDGLDGLAAGSAAMVFAAFVIIAFWQFRHPGVYHVLPAGSLDLAIVAAAMMGACLGLPVVERRPRAGVHGRRRLARARRGDGRPGAAHQHHPAAAAPRRPLRVRDPVGDRAGDLVPRASTDACCAWRRSTTTSRSGAGPSSP